MKKALVIGGNRFMGRNLVLDLLARGFDVATLNRGKFDDGLGDRIERLHADRNEAAQVRNALGARQFDVVFDQICFDAKVAREACEIFRERAGHFVFVSSASVFNEGDDLKESAFDPRKYDFTKIVTSGEDYSEAKRQAEAVFAREATFPVAILRPTFVVGTDDYSRRLHWHVERVREGQPIFVPNLIARLQFIRSDQAGRALAEIGERKLTGEFNLAAPGWLSLAELLQAIEKVVGREAVLGGTAETDHSPYGIEKSLTLNVDHLGKCNITIPPTREWLEELIQKLAAV